MKLLQLTFAIFLCFALCSCSNRVAGSKQVVEHDGKTFWVWKLKSKSGNAYEAAEYDPFRLVDDPSFQKNNLIVIEKVSGGKIEPYSVVSDPFYYSTQATVVYGDNSSVK